MKFKVLLRDDSQGNTVLFREEIIETDETKEKLLEHAHILEVIGEVLDEQDPIEVSEKKEVEDKPKKSKK